MNIGDTVLRKDPGGEEVIRNIFTKEDLDYHLDLQAKGYKYEVLGKAKVQVDPGANVCESCSS
jgi:hypothetical protein